VASSGFFHAIARIFPLTPIDSQAGQTFVLDDDTQRKPAYALSGGGKFSSIAISTKRVEDAYLRTRNGLLIVGAVT
jgi:hypothetical protein